MKSHADLFKEFADLGSRYSLSLKNGEYYEGYILEIGEESFEFVLGGALAVEAPLTIKYNSLDFKSLSFYDINEKCYKDAVWLAKADKWVITYKINRQI